MVIQIVGKKIRELFTTRHIKGVALIAAAVVVGAVGFLFYQLNQPTSILTTEEKVRDFVAEADERAFRGDIDGAFKAYDQAIALQKDKQLKIDLLRGKSTLAINNGRQEVAITAAEQAEKIETSLETVSLLAQLYDKQGNKQKAIEYYKKSLQALDKQQDEESSTDRGFFERRIQELEAAQ